MCEPFIRATGAIVKILLQNHEIALEVSYGYGGFSHFVELYLRHRFLSKLHYHLKQSTNKTLVSQLLVTRGQ